MRLYRFSPITSEDELKEAVHYVASASTVMLQQVLGHSFPITSLTIFSHYPDEYAALQSILSGMGKPFNVNNGPRVELHQPITAASQTITHLRIRQPDPYRMQVGCNDIDVADYAAVKAESAARCPANSREIIRPDYAMLEFFHPDFDILTYALSKNTP